MILESSNYQDKPAIKSLLVGHGLLLVLSLLLCSELDFRARLGRLAALCAVRVVVSYLLLPLVNF